jgi:hypothetical protein
LGILGVMACGARTPAISQTASTSLSAELVGIETAAANHDQAGAHAQLVTLRNDVLSYEASGQISGARATQILKTADLIDADLSLIPTTTTSTSTTTTTTTEDVPRHGHGGHGGSNDQGGGRQD